MRGGKTYNPNPTESYEIDLGEITVNVVHSYKLSWAQKDAYTYEGLHINNYYIVSVTYNGKTFVGNGHTETEALQNLSARITVYKKLKP